MLSTSSVGRAWKQQFLVWLVIVCSVRGFGCSPFPALQKRQPPLPDKPSDLHWGAPAASPQFAHQYWRGTCLEHVLKWEFPTWRKLLPRSSAWLHLVANLRLQVEIVPRNTSWESPKAFHCHLGEYHYLSPLTNQAPQQRSEMLSVISVSQMGNGKMKCSSLLQTDLSVISWAVKHKPAFV